VIGFNTTPTEVLAIAPAMRFPGTDNLTNADPDPLPDPDVDVDPEVEVDIVERGARVWN
jgi:hypothetical protein